MGILNKREREVIRAAMSFVAKKGRDNTYATLNNAVRFYLNHQQPEGIFLEKETVNSELLIENVNNL